jgi:hypothetical protein
VKKVEITRTRRLPYTGNVGVKIGQEVNCTDIIAEMNYFPAYVKRINVSKKLAIKPSRLEQVSLVEVGDIVSKDAPIAFSSRWGDPRSVNSTENSIVGIISKHLGMIYLRKLTEFNQSPREVFDIKSIMGINDSFAKRSIVVREGQKVTPGQIIAQNIWKDKDMNLQQIETNLFGVVEDISENVIIIKNRLREQSLKAYLCGKVIDIVDNIAVTIKSEGTIINGIFGVGGERSGRIRPVNCSCLGDKHIKDSDQGKILVSRGHLGEKALKKASSVGVAAIVAPSCKLSTIRRHVDKDFVPSITGSEDVQVGIIIINGFLKSVLAEELWDTVSSSDESYASVNGKTHIRAGAIRPELIIFN